MKYLLFLCLISVGLVAHISNDLYNAIQSSDEKVVEHCLLEDDLTSNEKKSLCTFAKNIIVRNKCFYDKYYLNPVLHIDWVCGLLIVLIIGGGITVDSYIKQHYVAFGFKLSLTAIASYLCATIWKKSSDKYCKRILDFYHSSMRILMLIESK